MNAAHRLPALDLLRGGALLCMVAYHGAYDLATYWHWDIGVLEGWWRVAARATAAAFLWISGVAIGLSEERLERAPAADRLRRRLRRAGMVGAAALLVSAVTAAADPQTYVRFGILHLIAVSRLLAPLTRRAGAWNIALGAALLGWGAGGPWRASSALLLPLGGVPPGFVSVDYFPLLPWYGVVLAGLGSLRLRGVRVALRSEVPRRLAPLSAAGRHALLTYLLHQPALLVALWLVLGSPEHA